MYRKLLRGFLVACGGLLGYGASLLLRGVLFGKDAAVGWTSVGFSVLCAALGAILFFIIAPYLGKKSQNVIREIESDLQKVPPAEFVPGIAGLIIGIFLAYLISNLYRGIPLPYLDVILSLLTYLFLGYLGVFIATRRGKDLLLMLQNARKQSPKKSKVREVSPKILDTSVIIDGRIADIMKTGFIEGNIVIPEFVLVELRHIADSSDALKRNRGRRGLDILGRIQSEYGIEIYNTASEKALDEIPEVDVKLLKLAQIMGGKVVTNDYNLNKVAGIKGVDVLNINELANTLKPVVLPGEEMQIFLVKEGKECNQAVAYLDDGTMIVVEDGRKNIGETVQVSVTSVLQTAAGRMIFAKIKKK